MEYSKILRQITMKRLFISTGLGKIDKMVIYEYRAGSLWCIDMQAVCFWCNINPYKQLRCTETLLSMAEVTNMNIHDGNGRGALCQSEYCSIQVKVLNRQTWEPPHCHEFQEFVLIKKGYCVHCYRGTKVWLLPGDVFVTQPNEEHSYQIYAPAEIIHCRFFVSGMSEDLTHMSKRAVSLPPGEGDCPKSRQSALDRQGIIYLNIKERREIASLLAQIMEEEKRGEEDQELVKIACLQMILVKLQRIQRYQTEQGEKHKGSRKERIYEILSYAESHLAERVAHETLAEMAYWSVGYFRSVFKDVTGMAPAEYLNRMRIAKSLEYMQKEHLNVSQSAERVGFDDPGYYSKLFKKIIGYSPKYFRFD